MVTPEERKRQADALARVRTARIERDRVTAEANRNVRRAIIAAMRTGASPTDIGAAAELSRQRIHQIYNEEQPP